MWPIDDARLACMSEWPQDLPDAPFIIEVAILVSGYLVSRRFWTCYDLLA